MRRLVGKLYTSALRQRATKRTILAFAEKMGLVYFGQVSQLEDDHPLIRGLTLSPKHRDRHYTVGTVQGYDLAFVERTDTIQFPGKPDSYHLWNIFQVDLHTTKDLPHIFIGLHSHSETFYAHLLTKFNQLKKTTYGVFGAPHEAFLKKYVLYTEPDETLTVERLLDHTITAEIGQHFGNLTIEISTGNLYLYSDNHTTSKKLLEVMLQNAIWLAEQIDERAEVI